MIRHSCHRHVVRGLPAAESEGFLGIDLQLIQGGFCGRFSYPSLQPCRPPAIPTCSGGLKGRWRANRKRSGSDGRRWRRRGRRRGLLDAFPKSDGGGFTRD
jgi:hypothetical protein